MCLFIPSPPLYLGPLLPSYQSEVDETLERIKGHKGVEEVLIGKSR